MGDHITGGQYLFFLGRGACLLLLAPWVIWLAPCLVLGMVLICEQSGTVGEQSGCVRGQSGTVGGTVGVCWFC